jgi:hypothetical protein
MPYKKRTESKELQILRSLNTRMELTPDQKKKYLYLERGYKGELEFDSLVEGAGLDRKFYILNDLNLEFNNIKFQLDSTIITQDSIILCEVKYYKDDYYYKNENFYLCATEKPITNPLHQLNRSKNLLQQFLQKNGFYYPIEGHLIFNHPEFFLYTAPQNEHITFPAHLNRFIHYLDTKPSNLSGKHRQLAELLMKEHIINSQNSDLPGYEYDGVRKGLTSGCCRSFLLNVKAEGRRLVCCECGHIEPVETAILRVVEEIKLLFPDMKITTNIVFEWCLGIVCRRTIIKVLKKYYQYIGYGQWSYFE